jgi:hypothetical protein
MKERSDSGIALLFALIINSLVLAIGLGVVTAAALEVGMNGAARAEQASFLAADAVAARAMRDLAAVNVWSTVLDGSIRSTFSGGPMALDLHRYGPIDLVVTTAALQQASDSFVRLGANAPQWRLFAWGWLSDLAGDPPGRGGPLVAAWVSDDWSETDNDPQMDSNGRVNIRTVAFGPAGAEQWIDMTVAQLTDPVGVRVVAWRTVR